MVLESIKSSYRKHVEYIIDENNIIVAVWYTDTDIMIVNEDLTAYTEEEIREIIA